MELSGSRDTDLLKSKNENLLEQNREIRRMLYLLQENVQLKKRWEKSCPHNEEQIKNNTDQSIPCMDSSKQVTDANGRTDSSRCQINMSEQQVEPQYIRDPSKPYMDSCKEGMDDSRNKNGSRYQPDTSKQHVEEEQKYNRDQSKMDSCKQGMDGTGYTNGSRYRADVSKEQMKEQSKYNRDQSKPNKDSCQQSMDGSGYTNGSRFRADVSKEPKYNRDQSKSNKDSCIQGMDGIRNTNVSKEKIKEEPKCNRDQSEVYTDNCTQVTDDTGYIDGTRYQTDLSTPHVDREKIKECGAHCPQSSRQLQVMQRIIGEIAFQLDRRILTYVFNDRLYGITVANIPQKITEASTDLITGRVDEKTQAEMMERYEDMMNTLKRYGYDPAVHPTVSENIVNAFGIMKNYHSSGSPDMGSLCDPANLKKIAYCVVPCSDLDNVLILLKCLCKLSRRDGKPIFLL